MANPVIRAAAALFVERPARRLGGESLVARLEAGRQVTLDRFAAADPTAARRQLRHVIQIERWGQRRLRVALGDVPFQADVSGTYAPADDDDLLATFADVRTETLVLGRRVFDERRDGVAVEHNSLGPLTARGWLQYLHLHADFEMKRARRTRDGGTPAPTR